MRLPKCLPVSRKGPRSAEMNEHILLVEDEQALRTALEIRLRAEGYVLDTAVDGEEALRKATNMPFDLIVLDVMLPVRNGFEVCREVRQQGMATPILLLTVRDKLVDYAESPSHLHQHVPDSEHSHRSRAVPCDASSQHLYVTALP